MTFTSCTAAGHPEGKEWCSPLVEADTRDHVQHGGHWGVCGHTCPRDPACPRHAGWQQLETGCYKLLPDMNMNKVSERNIDRVGGMMVTQIGGGSHEPRIRVVSSKCDQTAAAAACGEQGGRLLELEGGAELAALAAWLRALEPPCLYEAAVLWLGLRNTTAAGASSWVADSTGQTIAFSHWLDTEPNHAGDTEMCAAVFASRCRPGALGQ